MLGDVGGVGEVGEGDGYVEPAVAEVFGAGVGGEFDVGHAVGAAADELDLQAAVGGVGDLDAEGLVAVGEAGAQGGEGGEGDVHVRRIALAGDHRADACVDVMGIVGGCEVEGRSVAEGLDAG